MDGPGICYTQSNMNKKVDEQLLRQLAVSDTRIKAALELLQGTERGRQVLIQLNVVLSGPATGLDSQGLEALLTLCEEFCQNHRRGFIPGLEAAGKKM